MRLIIEAWTEAGISGLQTLKLNNRKLKRFKGSGYSEQHLGSYLLVNQTISVWSNYLIRLKPYSHGTSTTCEPLVISNNWADCL